MPEKGTGNGTCSAVIGLAPDGQQFTDMTRTRRSVTDQLSCTAGTGECTPRSDGGLYGRPSRQRRQSAGAGRNRHQERSWAVSRAGAHRRRRWRRSYRYPDRFGVGGPAGGPRQRTWGNERRGDAFELRLGAPGRHAVIRAWHCYNGPRLTQAENAGAPGPICTGFPEHCGRVSSARNPIHCR